MTESPAVIGLTLNYRDATRTATCVQSLLAEGAMRVSLRDNSEGAGSSTQVLRTALKLDA